MAKMKSIFTRVMDKDSDRAFVKQGFSRQIENMRFLHNDANDGIGVNIKGSLLVSDETGGNTDLKCITALFNPDLDVIYYFLASTDGMISKIIEFNIGDSITTVVAEDDNGTLNFNKDSYITGINEINGLLIFSEWGNNPRRLNVERAKTYGINGFTEEDIQLIVIPPYQKLKITLQDSGNEENNIEEKFLSFSYQWRYLDGEYSPLAPFTEFAFEPSAFSYDFSEQSSKSMVNAFNQIKIEFNTGNERVTEIRLVFKESESNSEWIIDDFEKAGLGYGHNETKEFLFDNNKVYQALSDIIIRNYSNGVPLTNKAQTLIDGRLILANYLENYNLTDGISVGNINIDYSLALVALPIVGLVAKRTVKSNRDLEIGMVYLDTPSRSTTILNSKTNTIFVPNANSITENSIDVILKHKPPVWAKYFRFFVKQTKKNYDQILPSLFYEDGVYRWVKLEGADKDKVKEGDYLIVKSDSQGLKTNLIKTKVLEVTDQDKNFLQPDDITNTIEEKSGWYFKVKPDGFRLDQDDLVSFNLETYDSSRQEYNNPIRSLQSYISKPHFYGDTLDDMTSSGSYTGSNNARNRYLIRIDTIGAVDTFEWSDDNGVSFTATGVSITGGIQNLNNGVSIQFSNLTNHSLADEWNINARATFSIEGDSRAYAFFRTVNNHDELISNFQDELIQNGARLSFKYDEYNEADAFFELDEISNDRYDNIEEWFHKENIITEITSQEGAISISQIFFVRGVLYHDDSATQITQNDTQGTMTMLIKSVGVQNSGADNRVKIRATSDVIQSDGQTLLLFETEPKDQPPERYFEIGKTYSIENGLHLSDVANIPTDVDQTAILDLRIKLDFFNAFSYGNAVESYKIKDEFNRKGLDVGIRVLTVSKEEYKQVHRKANATWSDVYEDDSNFNGLGTFNLSLINWVKLDREDASIQKLHNLNRNLLVLQEDAIGVMPYNKNVIYDVQGGSIVGISTNILEKNSYRPYGSGKHGISKNPESFIQIGGRIYFTDQMRGDLIQLANDGITEVNQYLFEHKFSKLMSDNKGSGMVGGYDPKHKEYLVYVPENIPEEVGEQSANLLSYKEIAKGFSTLYSYVPDFMVHANNELYAWKNGVMFRMNATTNYNEFFGVQYKSKIKFFANTEFSTEKVFKSIGLESTHAWLTNIATKLTSRTIPKESFTKIEDYWFSEIMGNTNNQIESSNVFGLGTYSIVNSNITVLNIPDGLCIGDSIISADLLFLENEIIDVDANTITLQDPLDAVSSFLMYKKNQNIDGASIRGDILEVELISDETVKVELRAVNIEASKSNYS